MRKASVILAKMLFYRDLTVFIMAESFSEDNARILIADHFKIRKEISIDKFDSYFLSCIHREYHDQNSNLEMMEKLAESAFRDLSSHMRDPEVRNVFYQLSTIAGTNAESEMFVTIKNTRPLGNTQDGIAVVTLVVADLKQLKILLAQNKGVEVIHSV